MSGKTLRWAAAMAVLATAPVLLFGVVATTTSLSAHPVMPRSTPVIDAEQASRPVGGSGTQCSVTTLASAPGGERGPWRSGGGACATGMSVGRCPPTTVDATSDDPMQSRFGPGPLCIVGQRGEASR